MANEKRLIDAVPFREWLLECYREEKGLTKAVLLAVMCRLKTEPTIDAVEVVRCKDCKWCKDGDICTNKQWQDAEGWDRDVDPEGFCYLGERSCCK